MLLPALACSDVKGPLRAGCCAAANLFPTSETAKMIAAHAANRLTLDPGFIIVSLQNFKSSLCSAHLQVGILHSSTCPPEGGHYIDHFKSQPHKFPSGAPCDWICTYRRPFRRSSIWSDERSTVPVTIPFSAFVTVKSRIDGPGIPLGLR